MKRTLVTVFACLMLVMGFTVASTSVALAAVEAPAATADPFAELKAKIVPELESILTPEQRTQFEDAIANGTNVKKAFKSIALTPEQKGKVGMMMKSVPKDVFTSLTPEQKRELFMQKKDFFMASGKSKAEAAIKTVETKVTDAMKAVGAE
ncbi:MAG: hypothetical protein KME10_02605 [Plectolyngbya sp. WJT66-NPBG17]|jgi:Spy/CpxP family protein refolding chaperone|nr:hypothetical protein [Plectolyngbya sp. WJT66-NPBG17]MBW4524074.1 hypothetical protein [Phormidium tanganyikae FI6-MK23]